MMITALPGERAGDSILEVLELFLGHCFPFSLVTVTRTQMEFGTAGLTHSLTAVLASPTAGATCIAAGVPQCLVRPFRGCRPSKGPWRRPDVGRQAPEALAQSNPSAGRVGAAWIAAIAVAAVLGGGLLAGPLVGWRRLLWPAPFALGWAGQGVPAPERSRPHWTLH